MIVKIIFLGSQGSGKSTQAKLLASKLGLPWIEMGQILRQRSAEKDKDAQEIKKALEAGDLVSDKLVVKTLSNRLTKADCLGGYVLDGYPRNFAQLEALDPAVDDVFYVRVSDSEAIKRLMKRGRIDDTFNVVSRRLELYHKLTEPLLEYFRQKGILEEIDGEREAEDIAKEISQKVKNAQ